MSRALLLSAILAICFAAAPAQATPIPLLEMTWQQGDFENGPLPVTVPFRFEASGEHSTEYLDWTTEYGPGDVAVSFMAPAQIVNGANAALADQRASYTLENGPGNFVGPVFLFVDGKQISQGPCDVNFFCSTFFVDDVTAHTVIAVERIIDYLILTEIEVGEHYAIAASQTIRYWGVPIPEPSSVALVLFALVIKNFVR